MTYKVLLVALPLLVSHLLFSQAEESNEKSDDGSGLIVLPAFFSSPETSVGLGAGGMYYFRTDQDTTTKVSNIQAIFIYTFRNQLLTELPFTFFFNQNKYWLTGSINYYIYPFRYYGQGNNIDFEVFDNYDARYLRTDLNIYRRIAPDLYIGPKFLATRYYSITSDGENGLLTPEVTGFAPGMISGLGVGMILDRRNNLFSPDGGYYIEFSLFKYGKFVGSDYEFSNLWFDARKYVEVGEKKELGFQLVHQSVTGSGIPFYNLASLGGSTMMRGYFSGAYRDQHYTAMQGEFRVHFLKYFVGSAFAGIGTINSRLGSFNNILPSGGVGVRWEIDKQERIRIRLDYAIGKGTSGFYININEAF